MRDAYDYMADLQQAVKLGMESRRVAKEYGAFFLNPMVVGTDLAEAWDAGYRNDVHAWLDIRRLNDPGVPELIADAERMIG